MAIMRLIRNSARCLLCWEDIESKHRHDMVFCSGNHVGVDGGLDYIRRVFSTDQWLETSQAEDDGSGEEHWFNYNQPDGRLCSCDIGYDHYK